MLSRGGARAGEGVGEWARPSPSPLFPAFQPVKAPVMLWNESCSLNTSGPISSNMTVKVRVLNGQGLTSRGEPGGL